MTEYKGFIIIDKDDFWSIQHENEDIQYEVMNLTFQTEEEAKEYIDDYLKVKQTTQKQEVQKPTFKSATLSSIQQKYPGFQSDVYVLRYDNGKYASRKGITSFNASDMLIFLDPNSAFNSIRYRRGSWQIVKAKYKNGRVSL